MRRSFLQLLVLALTVLSSCTKKPNEAKLSSSELASETSSDSTTTETFDPFGIKVSITDKAMNTFVISESYSKDEKTGQKHKAV